MRRLSNRTAGFTLIELVVAVALFTLAMGLAYGGLDALLRARRQLDVESERLRRWQFAVGLLERDVRGVIARPVRDAVGAPRAALLLSDNSIELSRAGFGNELNRARAEIERVAWRWQDRSLVREAFEVLDALPQARTKPLPLLAEIDYFSVEALGAEQRWLSEWPPRRATAESLPRALRVRLRSKDFGEIERLLELPQEPGQ